MNHVWCHESCHVNGQLKWILNNRKCHAMELMFFISWPWSNQSLTPVTLFWDTCLQHIGENINCSITTHRTDFVKKYIIKTTTAKMYIWIWPKTCRVIFLICSFSSPEKWREQHSGNPHNISLSARSNHLQHWNIEVTNAVDRFIFLYIYIFIRLERLYPNAP